MPDITVLHEGRFFFVGADDVPLGHAYKVVGFEGESAWRSALRLIFRSLWRASANTADGEIVHLEESYGSVFRSRNEAIGAILAYHGMSDPRYPAPST